MKIKPLRKAPAYFKSETARKAQSGASRKAHPDYFVPVTGTKYWIALLPGHPKHPKDEEGNPSPFVVVERYFSYRTEEGDVRGWPVLSSELVSAGKDPLFKRSARLLSSDDEEDRKVGWALKAKGRVAMNVIVLAMKVGDSKRTRDVGVYGKKPHIMEVGGQTWSKQFEPERMDEDEDPIVYYDLFGVETDVVPVMRIQKVSSGPRAIEVDWSVKRTSKAFEIPKKLRKMVLNILAHETNQPHTEEELKACLQRAAAADGDDDVDNVDFDESEDTTFTDDETEEVPDPDEEEEEEEAPKKKKKKKKSTKKKKVKKEEEDEDFTSEFSEEDDAFEGDDDSSDEDEEDFI